MGTDFLSPRTRLVAKAKASQLHYGKYNLHHVLADAQIANGKIHAKLDSKNELLDGEISVDALASTKKLQATLVADVRHADMYELQVTKKPVSASLCGHIYMHSDLKDSHQVWALMDDITIRTPDSIYRPGGMNVDIKT